jgi:hypothetical protein
MTEREGKSDRGEETEKNGGGRSVEGRGRPCGERSKTTESAMPRLCGIGPGGDDG